MLLGEAEAMEQARVVLRGEGRAQAAVATEGVLKRRGLRELAGDLVGRLIVVGRDLNRELASRSEGSREPREDRLVVVDPVQSGVGEDQVEGCALPGGECREVPLLEAQPGSMLIGAAGEHRRGAVYPQRLGRPKLF